MRTDPDIAQLFDMNIGDESTSTFKDIFDCIDDDGSSEITFEEFAAFFEKRQDGCFHAGDRVEALYAEEGMWYVAKIIKRIKMMTSATNKEKDKSSAVNEKGPPFNTDRTTDNRSNKPTIESYMVRFTEYPDEGPFKVGHLAVRARFHQGKTVTEQ